MKFFQKNSHTLFWILIATVLVVASLFRLSAAATNSFAFTYDVGRDLLEVEKIVTTGKIPLIGQTTGLVGLFYGPWWYLFLIGPFLLSQGNPQGVAFFMAGIGIGLVVLAGLVGNNIANKWLGLMMMFMVGFSSVFLGFSSQIWNPNPIPFFVALILLLVLFLLRHNKSLLPKHRRLVLVCIGLIGGFILDLEIVFGILYGVGLISGLWFVYFRKKDKGDLLFVVAGYFIMILPRILFEFRHDFIMTRTLTGLIGQDGGAQGVIALSFMDVATTARTFFYIWSEAVAGQSPLLGTLFLGLTIYSCGVLFKRAPERERHIMTLLITQVIVLYIGIVILSDSWGHFTIGLPLFSILICSLSLFWFVRAHARLLIPVILILVVAGLHNIEIKRLPSVFVADWEGDAAVYRNQLAVAKYLYTQAAGKPFHYIAYTPAVHDYSYRYLLSWYGRKYHGYGPSAESVPNFYVILEPDHEIPDRQNMWLAIRKDDGRVVKEETVKGGIVVQTREH